MRFARRQSRVGRIWQSDRAQLKNYNILRDEQLKSRGAMGESNARSKANPAAFPRCYTIRARAARRAGRAGGTAIYPVRDHLGQLTEVVLMLQDVTERKIIEVERSSLLSRERFARAEAEAANRAKDEFLAWSRTNCVRR